MNVIRSKILVTLIQGTLTCPGCSSYAATTALIVNYFLGISIGALVLHYSTEKKHTELNVSTEVPCVE